MKNIEAHAKKQNFILFWLGLLTGALLIVALYSAGGSEDLLGKVRGRSYQVPTYAVPVYNYGTPTYNIPAYNYNAASLPQPNFVVPGNGYDTPDNDYGLNSVLHAAPSVSGGSLRDRVIAPSPNRYGVSAPNYSTASYYSPVINSYDIPDSDINSAY